MLTEQVEKAERDGYSITTATGACHFCGQVGTHKALPEWGQEEIDELLTETCDCSGACNYTHNKKRRERAHSRIEMLFEKDETIVVDEAAVRLLHEAVSPVCEGFVQSITVDTGKGIKGKMNLTAKGAIKVTRTITDTSAYEA